ncbi:DUF3144 domain-containing protein [Thermomonas sp.]|uniref:DUF3144 domain-containing protein n=1 Tax=Thermomonas sp. TaxID=1971895 RepID=UPI002C529E9E|nr:DUF3144 domain-containing protein [Thermomonas sp.]HRO63642.1 DUF3144 domain-containing protein [Thermomonas sp.]
MAEDNQAQPANAAQQNNQIDPAFIEAVNEYLAVADKQAQKVGPNGPGLAIQFAAARFNAHHFLSVVKPIFAAQERKHFLDEMSGIYRKMLNQHLDGIGEERGIDVGESELADEYAAAGVQIGRLKDATAQTPAEGYVAAAQPTPPTNPA